MPRTEYNKRWYEAHRDEISAKRKDKYRNDPEHRMKLMRRSSEYRQGRREVPRVMMRSFKSPIIAECGDGGEIVLYSSGVFSAVVRRSSQALSEWEREGIIPRTPYRHGLKGFRFYTVAMMKAVMDEIAGKRRLFPVSPGMKDRILAAWSNSGVPVDEDGGMQAALKRTRTVGVVQLSLESLAESEEDDGREGGGQDGRGDA